MPFDPVKSFYVPFHNEVEKIREAVESQMCGNFPFKKRLQSTYIFLAINKLKEVELIIKAAAEMELPSDAMPTDEDE